MCTCALRSARSHSLCELVAALALPSDAAASGSSDTSEHHERRSDDPRDGDGGSRRSSLRGGRQRWRRAREPAERTGVRLGDHRVEVDERDRVLVVERVDEALRKGATESARQSDNPTTAAFAAAAMESVGPPPVGRRRRRGPGLSSDPPTVASSAKYLMFCDVASGEKIDLFSTSIE